MNLFEAVKQSVTARQAAEAYGIRAGRNEMAVCPFHPDKNPSMKLGRRYHCFACQADGDVIDFVSAYFSLSLKEAAVKLAEDFQIPYDNWKPPDRRYRKAVPKKSLEQKFTERQNLYFRILCRYRDQLYRWKTEYAPKSPEEEWHPLFFEALERITRVNYLLDILLFGSLEDRAKMLISCRREVERYVGRTEKPESGAAGGTEETSGCPNSDAGTDPAGVV